LRQLFLGESQCLTCLFKILRLHVSNGYIAEITMSRGFSSSFKR
jgi:hypothetical protein